MAAATPRAVAKAYFAAVTARDVDGMVACWAPGGREHVRGQVDTTAPDGVREFFTDLFAAVPDLRFEIEDIVVEKERAVVRWSAGGTFAGDVPLNGIRPNGARLSLEGCDVLTIRDGLIVSNDAFMDSMEFARQIGVMPPAESGAERAMSAAFNLKERVGHRLGATDPEEVADGVWLVRGGVPAKLMNVYLVRDGDGVLAFDAGIQQMTKAIGRAAGRLGGLTRIVLGHAHADHRGAAAGLGAPVYCHEVEVDDAEGDGGAHTFRLDLLPPGVRTVYRRNLKNWDGGPVQVTGTLQEGDEVAGFRVVHMPGHARGQIALYRSADGVCLSSDSFYTIDPVTLRPGGPRVAHEAFTPDVEEARRSLLKLADLEPSIAFPGHAHPVTGDVAAQLRAAATATA